MLKEQKDNLPAVLLDIARLIGDDKALTLASSVGGCNFHVPTTEKAGKNRKLLIDLVGEAATDKIIAYYGGDRLYIPNCKAALTNIRNNDFCRDVKLAIEQGQTKTAALKQAAIKYGFSERWGYNLLSKANNAN